MLFMIIPDTVNSKEVSSYSNSLQIGGLLLIEISLLKKILTMYQYTYGVNPLPNN